MSRWKGERRWQSEDICTPNRVHLLRCLPERLDQCTYLTTFFATVVVLIIPRFYLFCVGCQVPSGFDVLSLM